MKGFLALSKLAAKSAVKQFANKYNLVYFGTVSAHSDDHQLVRGVTAASSHSDSHYTVGTYNGHDLILVERHNTVSYPGLPTTKHHWLILQVDLNKKDLPHIFIDSHHDATFHSNIQIGHSKLRDISSLVPGFDHNKIFAPVERLDTIHAIAGHDFMAAIHGFKHFDYEINGDQLFVYAHNPLITAVVLTDMLRVGVWLADYLNNLKT